MNDEQQAETANENKDETQEAPKRRGLLGWICPSRKRAHWALLRLAIAITLVIVFRYHVLTWCTAGHNYVWKKWTGSETNHPGDMNFLLRLRGPGVSMLVRLGEAEILEGVADPRLASPLSDLARSHSEASVRLSALRGLAGIKGQAPLDAARSALSDPEPEIRIFAVEILCDKGDKDQLPALRDALDGEEDQGVRRRITWAISVLTGERKKPVGVPH